MVFITLYYKKCHRSKQLLRIVNMQSIKNDFFSHNSIIKIIEQYNLSFYNKKRKLSPYFSDSTLFRAIGKIQIIKMYLVNYFTEYEQ